MKKATNKVIKKSATTYKGLTKKAQEEAKNFICEFLLSGDISKFYKICKKETLNKKDIAFINSIFIDYMSPYTDNHYKYFTNELMKKWEK